MKFTVSLTSEEKRAIYVRAQKDAEKCLISALIAEGYDPDAFDETTFVPRKDPAGEEVAGDEFIARSLEALTRIKANISDLG